MPCVWSPWSDIASTAREPLVIAWEKWMDMVDCAGLAPYGGNLAARSELDIPTDFCNEISATEDVPLE